MHAQAFAASAFAVPIASTIGEAIVVVLAVEMNFLLVVPGTRSVAIEDRRTACTYV